MSKTLFVIDAYNLIYRMFYAIPEMHTRTGIPVNAIFGVAKFLQSLADENPNAELVVANDVGKSFRADMFVEYKGTRDRMPDNLRSQIDGVFSLFQAAGIPILSQDGYEADDIIGSIAIQHASPDTMIVIISSDKDLCQFVDDGRVHIYDAMKRKFMKRSDVVGKFGVPPEQVRDYLAIVGDSSDNIPGITGFGPKKAVQLLSEYGSVEALYTSIGFVSRDEARNEDIYAASKLTAKTKESLWNARENAFLSKTLATIVTDLTVSWETSHAFVDGLQSETYIALLKEYDFRSLLPKDMKSAPRPVIDVTEIPSYDVLSGLLETIITEKLWVVVRIDAYRVIWLSVEGKVYSLDTKHVDTSALIDAIFEGSIQTITYNMKALLHELSAIKKPRHAESERQESLF